ncbi:MAG: hypothetical protein HZB52_04015 [Chloroflexi bacterium]|nr:hypothetical protein [Chloroflexota bacterium]
MRATANGQPPLGNRHQATAIGQPPSGNRHRATAIGQPQGLPLQNHLRGVGMITTLPEKIKLGSGI